MQQLASKNKIKYIAIALIAILFCSVLFPSRVYAELKGSYNGGATTGTLKVTDGWLYGASSANTAVALYIVEKSTGTPVSKPVFLSPTNKRYYDDGGTKLDSYHKTTTSSNSFFTINGLPYPITSSLTPNGDAIKAWLTGKSNDENYEYRYEKILEFVKDGLNCDLTSIMKNKEKYCIVLEPMAWLGVYVNDDKTILVNRYLEPGTADDWVERPYVLFTSAFGWARFYEWIPEKTAGLVAYQPSGDTMMEKMTHEALPGSMVLEQEWFGLGAHAGESMRRLTNSEIMSSGYGIHVIEMEQGQTTYDEPQGETPAPPPHESDGSYNIVKSYRERNSETNVLTHVATYVEEKVAGNITIEQEPLYRVKAWKVSTVYDPSVDSVTWETSVPQIISKEGSTVGNVKLTTPNLTLYVLLEKKTETKPLEANYILSESKITRRIKLSNPDSAVVNGVTMKDITLATFEWKAAALSCPGHTHTSVDDCDFVV